jgi:plasmid stabilization system protein ParE
MAYRVELTERAKRDLGDLYAHINATESAAAARWFNGLEESVYGLESFPRRCPVCAGGQTSQAAAAASASRQQAPRLPRHL